VAAPQVTVDLPDGPSGYATLRICRPGVGNALSRDAAEELSDAVDALAADPPAGVVVAAEGDRFFCAGGDLQDYRALTDSDSALEVSLRMQDILGRLRALPCLVVAAVEGAAIGGGAELALACDLRVAGAGATIALPQSRLGVVVGWGGGVWLVEAVGRGRAVELLTTGRTLGAQEAAAVGLVDTVVPAGQAESAAADLVAQARTASPAAVRAVKAVLDPAGTPADVARIFADLWVGEDHRAAEAAWWNRPRATG
jgi:enoyl-CoA hydratase/carnithine racemase